MVGPDVWKARLSSPYAHSRAALDTARRLWEAAYPDEPFHLDMVAAASGVSSQEATPAEEPAEAALESRIGYRITLAAQRQGVFYYDVRLHYHTSIANSL